ncbi:hypothetical protein MPRG_30010 [Mycobacterium paragordonae]|uniref:Uncharacterized protein n=1 Tax=Mycobacterium paragordonae TaxID=1389713 RepID=A0ABQ1C5J5_9MYCO|nr:hypothetical protein MPRG_30010 [Mycobacterium paragordonae]
MTARNCTLPRPVSSKVADPNSWDKPASVANWAAASTPPGNRTRTSAPSAAWCTCSAPGQASESRILATRPRYGAAGLANGLAGNR